MIKTILAIIGFFCFYPQKLRVLLHLPGPETGKIKRYTLIIRVKAHNKYSYAKKCYGLLYSNQVKLTTALALLPNV